MVFAAAVLLGLPIQPVARADTGAKIVEEVDFATSCSPAVQQAFRHAAWTLHSFWYAEALKEFTAVTEAEPSCAIGYWGIAMSHWYPLWYPPGPAALKAGSDAVAKAMAAPTKTERETDYIAAVAAFYHDSDKLDHRTRAVAYEKAMEQVYLRYPEDREAGVFYALALNATALPTDKTYANKRKAAEILDKVWAEQPNHPGVVHYLIHSDDSPQFAEAGLSAAICYAKIAPEVPHALHMPSHIFTRLGLWQQSIDSNVASHAASIAYVRKTSGPGAFDGEIVHSMDYLEYAYLQTAQDHQAKEVVDELLSFRKGDNPNLGMSYAVAAIPVRFALERRDWQTAASLSPPQIGYPLERFPWAGAMISSPDRSAWRGPGTPAAPRRKSRRSSHPKTACWRRRTPTGPIRSRSCAWGPPASSLMSSMTTKRRSSWCARRPISTRRWTSTRPPRPRCSRRANCSPTCCSSSTSPQPR